MSFSSVYMFVISVRRRVVLTYLAILLQFCPSRSDDINVNTVVSTDTASACLYQTVCFVLVQFV